MDDMSINNIVNMPRKALVTQVTENSKVKTEIATESDTPKEDFSNKREETVDVEELIASANKIASAFKNVINFRIDEEGEPPVIIVTDKETGKVIRQIPQEEMIRLSDKMEEFIGMIFNGRI